MQEVTEKRHITEEMWIALENNTIQTEEFMQILEHTCECTWCAEQLAVIMESDAAAQMPPSYLGEEILERTKQLDVQAAVTVKKTSKRLQLFWYSLRVSAAVAVSILILGITSNFQDIGFTQLEQSRTEAQLYPQTEWKEEQQAEGSKEEAHTSAWEKESVLKRMNRASGGITQGMSSFTNWILNGGKEE